ncbi:MAG: PEP-CTERM sorting domain-containing protein [Kiritimatiellales bacterium]
MKISKMYLFTVTALAAVAAVQAGVILEDNFLLGSQGGTRSGGDQIVGTRVDTVATNQLWIGTGTAIKLGGTLTSDGYAQNSNTSGSGIPMAVSLPTGNLQNEAIGGLRLTTSLRVGDSQWIAVGLWSDSSSKVDLFSENSLSIMANGNGSWSLRNDINTAAGAAHTLASGTDAYVRTDFVNVQMDWFKDSNTVDLYLNGTKVVDQLDLGTVATTTGTGFIPDIDRIGVHFLGTTVANSSAVDYVKLETIPEPATLGMVAVSSFGLLLLRRALIK